MARDNNQPFDRGMTYFGTDDAVSAAGGSQYEGQEKLFEDIRFTDATQGAKPYRSGLPVTCRIVRNLTGGNALPRLAYTLNPEGTAITALATTATTAAEPAVVADEYLPAGGARVNDLLYVVVDGPTEVVSPSTGNFPTAITAKARVAANVAGRVTIQAATTAPDVRNALGRSVVALATTALDTPYLILVKRPV